MGMKEKGGASRSLFKVKLTVNMSSQK